MKQRIFYMAQNKKPVLPRPFQCCHICCIQSKHWPFCIYQKFTELCILLMGPKNLTGYFCIKLLLDRIQLNISVTFLAAAPDSLLVYTYPTNKRWYKLLLLVSATLLLTFAQLSCIRHHLSRHILQTDACLLVLHYFSNKLMNVVFVCWNKDGKYHLLNVLCMTL